MKAIQLCPEGFAPPRELTLGGVRMRVLGMDDLEPDYEAVMESAAELPGLFHPEDAWPAGLSKRDNQVDLAWHEKEFKRGSSYAWGLWRADGERYLGSAYVNPDAEGLAAAHAVHWIRTGEADDALRAGFKSAWEAWVRGWPLASVRFSPE